MRGGFGIIYAVIVMVLIGTIGIYTLELSSRSVTSVSDEHINIQLQLYMNSSVEYVLLWLSGGKSRSRNATDMNISYEGGSYTFQLHTTPLLLDIPESNGTVLLDVAGRFENSGAAPITLTKRLVIKP